MADVMIDLLKAHLRQLHLPTMGAEVEKLAQDTAATDQTFVEFLLRLTELELAVGDVRHNRTVRIKQAGFPVLKDFDTYDFTALPGLSRPKVLGMAQREWIEQKSNCCLIGGQGTGKTRIAIAFGASGLSCGPAGGLLHRGGTGQRAGEGANGVRLGSAAAPVAADAVADLRRTGLRQSEPWWRRAVVPRVRRSLQARQHPGDEQPAV